MEKEEPGKGLGAKWEGNLIYQHIYEKDTQNFRFIPVIFEPDHKKYIPLPLRSCTYYILNSEQGYNAIYRRLTHQPKIIKPELGRLGHSPSFKQFEELFTPQIASTMDVVGAEYCPKNHQLTLQINIYKPGLLENLNIPSNLLQKTSDESKIKPISKIRTKILPLEKRRFMGLMAVSYLPLKPFLFKQIFPGTDWAKEMRKFARQGILGKKQNEIYIPKSVKKALLDDPKEVKSFHQEWINVLDPIKNHIDIPGFLALHYFALERFDEAIMVMVDILTATERGWVNDLYLSIFESIAESKILNKINPETRVHLYNAIGICLSRNGSHMEAVKWYLKLRNYSRRIKHSWGIGQSYINGGLAYFKNGDIEKAKRYYRKAVDYCRNTDDKWLLGRSLHNLAMTIYERDVDEASRLMDESIKIKEEIGDLEGIAAAYLGFGNLAIQRKEFKEALKWFHKTEKSTIKYGIESIRSLALINIGSTNADLNHPHKSISYFQEARKIAEFEGYNYALYLAIQGEAIAWFKIDEFEKAEKLFMELFKLKKMVGDYQAMIISLHDVGIMLIKQKKYHEARKIFGETITLAKKHEDWNWVYRCYFASASSHYESGDKRGALKTLRNSAKQEEKKGLHVVAGQLWQRYLELLIANNGKPDEIEQNFKRCIQCFERVENNYNYLSRIYMLLYQWRWDNNSFPEAIEALNKLAGIAEINNQSEEKIRAIDQKGICFQHLAKFKEAEEAHRYSLKRARSIKNNVCILNSLNNLGELLRKTHRHEDSIKMFQEAEKIAGEINDIEAQISISLNRALTVRQTGNIRESEKILLQCRDIARKNKFWYEYVRAIRGLAYTAELEGKNKLAESRYLEALKQADVYGLTKYRPEILLVYSDFLSKEKRFEDAVRILEKQKEHFENAIDAYFYYMSLAKLYENKNNPDFAKRYWVEAKNEASLIGNQTIVTECCEALERISRQEKESHLTEGEFERDIQNENDPKQKSLLMVRYMSLLLSRGKEKKAEGIFKDTLKVVRKHDFRDIKIDIHMKYGDYLWQKSSQSQYRALQAYSISVSDSIFYEDSYKCYLKTGKYVVDQLLTIDPKKRHNRIKALYERLSAWLQKDFKKAKVQLEFDLIDYILWPLKVSIRLPAISKDGIFEYQIYEKIEEEMKDLNRLSDSD
ncbi:MAG: tetratricopeptide repeat protein [Candidatus Aminicenantes bacterium]|nr:MAG: tetratricopeptide repeat protein [Candidatus Aminicenantes bacterium]